MFFTVLSALSQLVLGGMGIYVSVKRPIKKGVYIAVFIFFGLCGVVLTGKQANTAAESQTELQKRFDLLVEQGKDTKKGIIEEIKKEGQRPIEIVVQPTEVPSLELRTRISSLIAEGRRLQRHCKGIPNSYKTPAASVPDLANAIVEWQQRVEILLSFDLDPAPLQKWESAILYGTPESVPSIAIYCTVLGVKMDALSEIAGSKAQR